MISLKDQLLSDVVVGAVETIAAEMNLGRSARIELTTYLAELGERASKLEKLPHVSFYAAKTRRGGVNYRITYRVPGYRKRTERLGKMPRPAYKRALRVSEVLQQVKARLMPASEAYRELYVDNSSISKHVADFIASIRSNEVNPRYLGHTETRLNRCIDLGAFTKLRETTRDALPDLVGSLRAYVEPKSKKRLSASTINQYLATLRQFTKWATPTRLPADPLANTKGASNLEKQKRRDVGVEEIAQLVTVARGSGLLGGMPGADRAMLYLTAFATGLRRSELRATQVAWLKIDETRAIVMLPAIVTKNKKAAEQPLPAWLIADLKRWLNGRTDGPLFPTMALEIAEIFEADREAAREAWVAAATNDDERKTRQASDSLKRKTEGGTIVFHSLRHSYATSLVASLDIKTAQSLTRHSSAAMPMDRYAHSRSSNAAGAVEVAIPDPMRADQG